METTSLIVPLEAQPGKEQELATFQNRRELARRVSGGVEVTLYWDSFDNSTSVEVWQHASGETLAFAVPGARALDAFYHPFAHLPAAFGELPLNTHGELK